MKNFAERVFFFVFLLMNLQFIGVTGIDSEGDTAIKLYHPLSLALLIFIKPRGLMKIPIRYHLFFATVALGTVAAVPSYGLNVRAILLGYAYFMLCAGYSVQQAFGTEKLVNIVRNILWGAHLFVIGRVLFYIVFMGDTPRFAGGRPNLLFLYSGGNNLESTWIALTLVFFTRSKYFVPMCGASAFVALVYMSRTGLLLTVAAAGLSMVISPTQRKHLKSRLIMVAIAMFAFSFTEEAQTIIERFSTIGDDSEFGSATRLDMWEAAGVAISQNPIGYGVGNGISAIDHRQRFDPGVNNVHNIYVQFALETGLQGLLMFLSMVALSIRDGKRYKVDDQLASLLLLYLMGGLLQFHGYGTFPWLFLGMFVGDLVTRKQGIVPVSETRQVGSKIAPPKLRQTGAKRKPGPLGPLRRPMSAPPGNIPPGRRRSA